MRHPLMCDFAPAYGISWLLWAPLCLPALGVQSLPAPPSHHAFGALGPIAAAFTVSAIETGRDSPRKLLRSMGLWRGRAVWLLVAPIGPYALHLLGLLVQAAIQGHGTWSENFGLSLEFPQFSALALLAYTLVSLGFGEEVGWKGSALPSLQSRYNARAATLLPTLGWAIWRAPLLLYRPDSGGVGVAGVTGCLCSLLTGAVLRTWLYNESRGSLLVVALFHTTGDLACTSDASSPVVVSTAGALITLWFIGVILKLGPRRLGSNKEHCP